MKNTILQSVICLIILGLFQACGESEAERQAREKARLDSLRAVQQAEIDRLMQARQDSIDAANASLNPAQPETGAVSYGDVAFDENGNYIVQVGAWRSEGKANSFVQKWNERGYTQAYTIKVGDEATGDVWFRVRIGFLSTKDAAERFGDKLNQEFGTPYWVSLVQR